MILITGASGIVGKAIFDILSAHGEPLIGLSHQHNLPSTQSVDLTDPSQTADLFNHYKFTTVIHCAIRRPSSSSDDPLTNYTLNMTMTYNLLSSLEPDTYFINISGTSIYDLRGEAILDEAVLIRCDSLYQLCKRHTEELLERRLDPTRLLNLRISSPYSTVRSNDSILYQFIEKAIRHEPLTLWGSGSRKQAFTNVETLAADIYRLIGKKLYGTFNYVTTQGISMQNLAFLVAKHFKDIMVVNTGNDDPEEECRTTISNASINHYLVPVDSLEHDIERIVDRLKAST